MYHENLLALVEVGHIDMYLTVETSGTHQGRVEHVCTVGGSQRDDTAVGAKTVHLGQQGVQGVLAFVIASHGRILRTCTTHCVNLVDEDDAGGFRLGLLEQVAYTAGTHTDEHLNEVGTAHGEEGHTCLAGYCLGQQGLTCSRRTYQQGSLGNLTSQIGVFLGILQEVHYLLHLLLGTSLTGHVLEGDAQRSALLVHLGFRLAHTEDASTSGHASTAHAAHDEHPYEDDACKEENVHDERVEELTLTLVVIR